MKNLDFQKRAGELVRKIGTARTDQARYKLTLNFLQFPTTEIVGYLNAAFESQPRHRWVLPSVLNKLVDKKIPGVKGFFFRLLSDRDPAVRANAARIVAARGWADECIPELLAVAQKETPPDPFLAVLEALGTGTGTAAFKALTTLAARKIKNPWRRGNILEGLANHRRSDARPIFQRVLKNSGASLCASHGGCRARSAGGCQCPQNYAANSRFGGPGCRSLCGRGAPQNRGALQEATEATKYHFTVAPGRDPQAAADKILKRAEPALDHGVIRVNQECGEESRKPMSEFMIWVLKTLELIPIPMRRSRGIQEPKPFVVSLSNHGRRRAAPFALRQAQGERKENLRIPDGVKGSPLGPCRVFDEDSDTELADPAASRPEELSH